MPMVSLKNRGNGPRAVINVRGEAVVLPVDKNRDAEPVEVEVDDHTKTWLEETAEKGGDLEVTGVTGGSATPHRAKLNLGARETAEQRAARERAEQQ